MRRETATVALRVFILACLLMPTGFAISAHVVIEPGTRPIGVAAPVLPTSSVQCNDFAEEVALWSKQLNLRHDACLKAESRKGLTGKAHKGACSFARCENVHNAMSKFYEVSSREIAQCQEQAMAAQTQMKDELGAFSSLDAAQSHIEKFAPAAVKQMRKFVEKKLVDQLRGLAPDKATFDATRVGAQIAQEMVAARTKCIRAVSDVQRIECEKQAYVTVMRLQSMAPLIPNTSPIIKKIQSDAFSRLNRLNEDTIRRLHELSQMAEGVELDDNEGATIGR